MKKKLTPIGIKEYVTKNGTKMQTLVLQTSYTSPPCKVCKKNAREDRSSRCLNCSKAHHAKKRMGEKLQNLINK